MKKGDNVAARTSKQRDQNEWILAAIVRHIPQRNRYEVEDVEEDESGAGPADGQRKKYILPQDALIPLPKSLPDPSKKVRRAILYALL